MKRKNQDAYFFIVFFPLIFFVVATLLSIGIQRFQILFFDKKDSIIFTTSLGLWIVLSIVILFFMLVILILLFLTKFATQTPKKFQLGVNKKERRVIKYFFLIGGIILVFSILNYAIITNNGVFFRDIRTGLLEKFYTWKQVKRVDIESYQNSRSSSINLRILVVVENARVNLMNASWYNHNWLPKLRIIYLIAQKNDIQIKKKIECIDEGNQKILNFIEHGF